MEKRERIKELDAFRGIAAILVMLFHYTTQFNNSIGHAKVYPINVPWGKMSVSVFFILSGFLTIMNLRENETALNFAYKRMIRLYPAYWMSIILTTIAMMFLLPERVRPVSTILFNFTMLQSYLGFQHVDGVYWTLAIEIMFYSLIGAMLLFKQRKNAFMICIAWIVVSFLLSISRIYFDSIILKVINILLITTYSHMFIVGVMLFQLYRNPKQYTPHIIIVLCMANQFINFGLAYTIFFMVVTILLYSILYRKLSFSIPRSLEFIANISYPLYLIHQFIGFGIINLLESHGFTNEIYLVIPITISIVLAYLLHRFIEEPSSRYLRKVNPFQKFNQSSVVNLGINK